MCEEHDSAAQNQTQEKMGVLNKERQNLQSKLNQLREELSYSQQVLKEKKDFNSQLESKLKVYEKFKFPCHLKEHDFEIETCEGFSEEDVEFVLKTLITVFQEGSKLSDVTIKITDLVEMRLHGRWLCYIKPATLEPRLTVKRSSNAKTLNLTF